MPKGKRKAKTSEPPKTREPVEDHSDADAIYVVKEGGAIYWPNGKLRGLAGYVVRGDDPFMGRYFRSRGTPAMLVRDDNAIPVSPMEWPTQYRRLAGEEYRTKFEIAEAEALAEVAEKKAQDQAAIETRVASEIPPPDED